MIKIFFRDSSGFGLAESENLHEVKFERGSPKRIKSGGQNPLKQTGRNLKARRVGNSIHFR